MLLPSPSSSSFQQTLELCSLLPLHSNFQYNTLVISLTSYRFPNEMLLLPLPCSSRYLPLGTLPFPTPPLPFPSHENNPRHHLPLPIHTRRLSYSSSSSSAEEEEQEPAISVHSILRRHDVPEDACIAILSKHPDLFRRIRRTAENVDPKLHFLRSSAGLSGPEVAQVLLSNPYILSVRLHPTLSSCVTFFTSILPSREDLVKVLKRSPISCADRMEANLQALRDRGVPESAVLRFIRQHPRCLPRSTEKFVAALETVERLGLSPTNRAFTYAVGLACYLSKETFSRKLELLEGLGWSEEQVLSMFRKLPKCLGISDAKLTNNVAFFKEVLGWGPDLLCLYPLIMLMNLEERIIPRCAVLNVLMMKGLLNKQTRSFPRFKMAEKDFLAEYVDKYKEEVPEVLEAYQGNIQFTGWGWLKDVPAEEEAAVALKSS